jgi:hypothetical protein
MSPSTWETAPQPPPLPPSSGYPPSYPGQREYGQYDYGNRFHPYPQRRDLMPHRGSTVLVFGILSLVTGCLILGPIAWVMGNQDLKEMRAGRMDPEGESATNAGRILGIISTLLWGAGLAMICCVFMLAAMSGPRMR